MVRIQPEAFRLLLPTLADVLVGRQPPQGLETFGEVVGREELSEMFSELLVRLIVIALESLILDSAIHPLDLSVRPRVIDFGQPMLDAVSLADAVERPASPARTPEIDDRHAPAGRVHAVVRGRD